MFNFGNPDYPPVISSGESNPLLTIAATLKGLSIALDKDNPKNKREKGEKPVVRFF